VGGPQRCKTPLDEPKSYTGFSCCLTTFLRVLKCNSKVVRSTCLSCMAAHACAVCLWCNSKVVRCTCLSCMAAHACAVCPWCNSKVVRCTCLSCMAAHACAVCPWCNSKVVRCTCLSCVSVHTRAALLHMPAMVRAFYLHIR